MPRHDGRRTRQSAAAAIMDRAPQIAAAFQSTSLISTPAVLQNTPHSASKTSARRCGSAMSCREDTQNREPGFSSGDRKELRASTCGAVYAGRSVLGTTIGSYRVRSKIGEGGMGSVYLAEHASLGRRVAVKVLLPEMSHDRSIVTRFFNEARAAS